MVESLDIVHFSAGNKDKTGNVAAQVDQRVQFDGSLAPTKSCPRKKCQTEIDGRRIEGIDRLLEIDAQGIAGIEFSGTSNQDGGEIGVDAPVPVLVGLGQSVAGNIAANAHVVQF